MRKDRDDANWQHSIGRARVEVKRGKAKRRLEGYCNDLGIKYWILEFFLHDRKTYLYFFQFSFLYSRVPKANILGNFVCLKIDL